MVLSTCLHWYCVMHKYWQRHAWARFTKVFQRHRASLPAHAHMLYKWPVQGPHGPEHIQIDVALVHRLALPAAISPRIPAQGPRKSKARGAGNEANVHAVLQGVS